MNNHDILIDDLENTGVPLLIIGRAKNFDYHDSKTTLALPKVALVQDLFDAVPKEIRAPIIASCKEGKYDNPSLEGE